MTEHILYCTFFTLCLVLGAFLFFISAELRKTQRAFKSRDKNFDKLMEEHAELQEDYNKLRADYMKLEEDPWIDMPRGEKGKFAPRKSKQKKQ